MIPAAFLDKNWIRVIRVSTIDQEMQRQYTDTQTLIDRFHLHLDRTVELHDVSGRYVLEDDDVKEALRDLAKDENAGVIVSALDRLFRPDDYDAFAILSPFRKNHKLILSSKEGVIDPGSDAGWMMSLMSGAQAGMEWREMRRRTMQGKEEKRKEGRHVSGPQSLPKGVIYEKIRNEKGRVTGASWKYDGDWSERVRQAYAHLFEGRLSYDESARQLGFPTGKGLRGILQNPVWKGWRVHDTEAYGPDYLPQSRTPGKKVKRRRNLRKREEPLIVKINITPLISEEEWERAQAIINTRIEQRSRLRKERSRNQVFVASGLVRCGICGKAMYTKYGTKGHGQDRYLCASSWKKAPGCGNPPVLRTDLDPIIQHMFTRNDVINEIIQAIDAQQKTDNKVQPDPVQEKAREAAIEKFMARRANVLDMRENGEIDRTESRNRLAKIQDEIDKLNQTTPVKIRAKYDLKQIGTMLALAFKNFDRLAFKTQRAILLEAISEITVVAGAVIKVKFHAGFLEEARIHPTDKREGGDRGKPIPPNEGGRVGRKKAKSQNSSSVTGESTGDAHTANNLPRRTPQYGFGRDSDLTINFNTPIEIARWVQ